MTATHPVYLDNAATTRPLPQLKELAAHHLEAGWHNPSALYPPALAAEGEMTQARRTILQAAGCSGSLYFNSGGTEGANTVLFKGWKKLGGKPRRFIVSAYEHPCVYECAKALEGAGHDVRYIRPGKDGCISPEAVAELVNEDTALVSVMHVNNETGAINDLPAIGAAIKAKNPQTLFHGDGVQGFMKCPLHFDSANLDYYTVSAHKLHGLKGTGGLFCKKGTPLSPFVLGGGQEKALRSGTENTLGIAAFAKAVEEFAAHPEWVTHMGSLRALLLNQLKGTGVRLLSPEKGAPHIVNLAFPGLRGEVLLHLLEAEKIYISTGSACSSKKGKLSRVHQSLGLPKEVAEGAVRISFCHDNTPEEILRTAAVIRGAIEKYGRFTRR